MSTPYVGRLGWRPGVSTCLPLSVLQPNRHIDRIVDAPVGSVATDRCGRLMRTRWTAGIDWNATR